jgi:hypothetical protein
LKLYRFGGKKKRPTARVNGLLLGQLSRIATEVDNDSIFKSGRTTDREKWGP